MTSLTPQVLNQPWPDQLDHALEVTTLSDQNNPLESKLQKRWQRVKHACDKCRALRTRCDGMNPCQHCRDYDFVCAYTRVPRRRGRKGRRAGTNLSDQRDDSSSGQSISVAHVNSGGLVEEVERSGRQVPREFQQHCHISINPELGLFTSNSYQQPMDVGVGMGMDVEVSFQATEYFNETQAVFLADRSSIMELMEPLSENRSQLQQAHDSYYQRRNLDFESSQQAASPCTQTPDSLYMSTAKSISSENTSASFPVSPNSDCKYPVLQPLRPFLGSIITSTQACYLLELYFAQPSNSVFGCASPYVLTPIFRKNSFLRRDGPRNTSPALLATMIWVTALTSDAQFLGKDSRARSTVCEALFQVCLDTLEIENSEKPKDQPTYKYVLPNRHPASQGRCPGSTDADLVLAFVLIGIVISGGDTRRDCLKWWTSAWALAKNLKLNQEVDDIFPEFQSQNKQTMQLGASNSNGGEIDTVFSQEELAIEESKEERRRIWWLLYMTDRHLALSYNARLNILDAECRVYQPLGEAIWQDLDVKTRREIPQRVFGPVTTTTGVGLFEYFLPLMSILGDIIEIHHLGCHPRFGNLSLATLIDQVELSLKEYEKSLTAFENSIASTISTDSCSNKRTWPAKQNIQERLTIGYSKHISHVLHVLLHGRWDPISMLDGTDNWLEPESFVKCASHALSAAKAVSEILELDPELRFMPYIFGIYLLHGSFILLLFAERMDMTTSGTVSQACETIIRAHEVCITTLNTEYQRDFRRVLCSAVNAMRGIAAMNDDEHGNRRRELLSRFRWTRDGRGLAP